MGFGPMGGGGRSRGREPLDQQRIAKILGASHSEPVRGGGMAGLVQQYLEGKNKVKPWPWTFQNDPSGRTVGVGRDVLARLTPNATDEDGRIMAAGRDLLAACLAWVQAWGDEEKESVAIRMIEDAIAKAEGK